MLICGESRDVRNIMLGAVRQSMLSDEYAYIAIPYDGYTMKTQQPWLANDEDDAIAFEAFHRVHYVFIQVSYFIVGNRVNLIIILLETICI